MSKRGDCYDNPAMESWNHSFKVEAFHGEKFKTRDEAKKQVFECKRSAKYIICVI
jgi:putative transposase